MGESNTTGNQFCKDDHYCPGRGANLSYVCPYGMYSLAGSDEVGDCNCPTNAQSQQKASQVMQCVCASGYYRVYNQSALLGGWQCEVCLPGQFCYDNINRTCPPHSISLADADNVLDCFCTAGYANSSNQSEQELCVDCPANSYCEGKGVVESCVNNSVSPTQSRDSSKCYCDLGWKGVNNSECMGCSSPTFCYGGIEAQCSEGTTSEPLSWNQSNCSCIPGRWGPKGGPCIMCSAGKYNLLPGCTACDATVDTDCIKCAVGTASNLTGRNSTCDDCPEGTFSSPAGLEGATKCETCPNGTFALSGAGVCTTCPLGWWAAAGARNCTPCPVNTYLDLEGKGGEEACMKCPIGAISTTRGNSDPACSACDPGSYQLDGICVVCPPGAYNKKASDKCQVCLAGTYSRENATVCVDCAVGAYTGTNHSGGCELCAAGWFAEAKGASVCVACQEGFFSGINGSGNCSKCDQGWFAASGSSQVSSI